MSRDPWFPFFPFDYLSDPVVLCMTLEEQGAYVRLLCHAWHPPVWGGKSCPRGHLPNDPVLLTAMSGAGSRERWDEMADAILRAFTVTDDGLYLRQKRMVSEAENVERVREARSRAGKKSAKLRTQDKHKSNMCSTDVGIVLEQKPTIHTVTVTREDKPEPATRAPRKRHVDPAFPVKAAIEILSGGKRVIMPRGLNAKQVGQMVTVINAAKTPEALKRVFDWLEGGAQGFRDFIDLDALCSKIGTWLVASENADAGPVSDPRHGICEDAA